MICISSGHGLLVRGASGDPVPPQLDEVDEARRVVKKVAQLLRKRGAKVKTFNDDTSETQDENLETIVDWHNEQERELDISVHFNCYDGSAHGTEVLYVTQSDLADEVAKAIAEAGEFTNRGPKYRDDLYFLNNTEQPAILIEVCFVDNDTDAELYRKNFNRICQAVADSIV